MASIAAAAARGARKKTWGNAGLQRAEAKTKASDDSPTTAENVLLYMERATGMDLNGDGTVAGKPTAELRHSDSNVGFSPGSEHIRKFSALEDSINTPPTSGALTSNWSRGQMPGRDACVKTGRLDKQTLNLQWKTRFVAITTDKIFFSRLGQSDIVEMIVLEDVKGIEAAAVVDEDPNGPEAQEPQKLVHCQSLLQHADSFREHLYAHGQQSESAASAASDPMPNLQKGDKHKWLHTQVSKKESMQCFEIHTKDGGFNNGRSYMLKADSAEARDSWIEAVQKAIRTGKEERERARYRSLPLRIQRDLRRAYRSRPAQILVALLIVANFVINVVAFELLPPPGSAGDQVYIVYWN